MALLLSRSPYFSIYARVVVKAPVFLAIGGIFS